MLMRNRKSFVTSVAAGLLGLGLCAYAAESGYEVHDMSRPQPPVVTPGNAGSQEPVKPPSDAIVLFDGKDLSKWRGDKGEPQWKVENGYFEVVRKTGSLTTKDAFGDIQLHIEWSAPTPPKGDGQARGNSGVLIMGRYEFQVLDCYNNKTYPDGMAGGIYGQYPPLANACNPPGQWNVYDIVFRAPKFEGGKVVKPARATVFLNGVLVQDDRELIGSVAHKALAKYSPHPEKLPISLQDHGDPVRFRNVWVRPLPENPPVAVRPSSEK